MSLRSWIIPSLAVFCGCATTTPPPQPPPSATTPPPAAVATAEAKPPATDPATAPGLRIDYHCSDADLRVVVATVSWRGDAVRAALYRVDFTVFKEGFERGQFATLTADKGGKPQFATGLLRMERDPGRAFDVVAEPRRDVEKESIALDVSHVEPGVVYRWRVVSRSDSGFMASPVVAAQAPVCVADEVERKEAR